MELCASGVENSVPRCDTTARDEGCLQVWIPTLARSSSETAIVLMVNFTIIKSSHARVPSVLLLVLLVAMIAVWGSLLSAPQWLPAMRSLLGFPQVILNVAGASVYCGSLIAVLLFPLTVGRLLADGRH